MPSTTTVLIRRAAAGDLAAGNDLVHHLTPLLREQALFRLGTVAAERADLPGLIDETWMVFFRNRKELDLEGENVTPRIVSYLGRTVTYLVNNVLRREARRQTLPLAGQEGETGEACPVDPGMQSTISQAVERVMRNEAAATLTRALRSLEREELRVVILRVVEGLPHEEIGRELGLRPNTVAVRYRRALIKVREILGSSVLDDLQWA